MGNKLRRMLVGVVKMHCILRLFQADDNSKAIEIGSHPFDFQTRSLPALRIVSPFPNIFFILEFYLTSNCRLMIRKMRHNFKLCAILNLILMDYRLQVFREVAELQSVSKAARKLHLSQPAVTKHIQLLEADLRVPLFIRSAKGMVLMHPGIIICGTFAARNGARREMAAIITSPVPD